MQVDASSVRQFPYRWRIASRARVAGRDSIALGPYPRTILRSHLWYFYPSTARVQLPPLEGPPLIPLWGSRYCYGFLVPVLKPRIRIILVLQSGTRTKILRFCTAYRYASSCTGTQSGIVHKYRNRASFLSFPLYKNFSY